jgi:hypothetical protein
VKTHSDLSGFTLSSENTEEAGDLELESGKRVLNIWERAEISGSTASLPGREKTEKYDFKFAYRNLRYAGTSSIIRTSPKPSKYVIDLKGADLQRKAIE